MAANVKLSKSEIEKRAAAQNASNIDLMSMIGALGSSSSSSDSDDDSNNTVTTDSTDETEEDEIPVIHKTVSKTVTTKKTSSKTEKPGYISLVITPSLKKEWKSYCTEHGLSLTDCIKVSMKLLKDMEKKNIVSLEDGVLSYN